LKRRITGVVPEPITVPAVDLARTRTVIHRSADSIHRSARDRISTHSNLFLLVDGLEKPLVIPYHISPVFHVSAERQKAAGKRMTRRLSSPGR
jgi:hypothetical protein